MIKKKTSKLRDYINKVIEIKRKSGGTIHDTDLDIIRSWGEETVIAIIAIHRLGRDGYLEKDGYEEYLDKCSEYSNGFKEKWMISHEIEKINFEKDILIGCKLLEI